MPKKEEKQLVRREGRYCGIPSIATFELSLFLGEVSLFYYFMV